MQQNQTTAMGKHTALKWQLFERLDDRESITNEKKILALEMHTKMYFSNRKKNLYFSLKKGSCITVHSRWSIRQRGLLTLFKKFSKRISQNLPLLGQKRWWSEQIGLIFVILANERIAWWYTHTSQICNTSKLQKSCGTCTAASA